MRKLISVYASHLMEFYEYKKLCGFKYEKAESTLYLFDRYYHNLGLKELKFTRDIIEPFLELKPNERIGNQIARACLLRQFGKFLFIRGIVNNIYIIPTISKKGESEYIPYIFTRQEYAKIINYIDNYKSKEYPGMFNLSPNTINAVSCAMKILMSTGMRLGEVLGLKYEDIDFENQLIYLKVAKNNNQRLIPFSITIKQVLLNYLNKTPFIINKHDSFFHIAYKNSLTKSIMHRFYYKSLENVGIKHQKGKGPRIHDFRHTFAVMSLTQLQAKESNINLSLSYLSTYLGHKSLRETQKYIWLTPSLFNDIKAKMKDYSHFIIDIFEEEKFDED